MPILVPDIQVDVPLGPLRPDRRRRVQRDGSMWSAAFEPFPVDVDLAVHVDTNASHASARVHRRDRFQRRRQRRRDGKSQRQGGRLQ